MCNYKIINGKLLLSTENGYEAISSELYIKEGKIVHIGVWEQPDGVYETVDASHKLIMPGLINMHTHLYMTVMRNYADDVDFGEWLFNRVMPVEDNLTKDVAYWSSLLGAMEMIKTGTTSFVDMHMFEGQSCKAVIESGLRGFIGRGLVGEDLYGDGKGRFEEALREMKEYQHERLQFILSPHAMYSGSDKLYQQVAEESRKLNILKQTHLSESANEVETVLARTGKSPVAWLDELGWLDDRTILAHCVKVDEADMDILKRTGAHVVTNPASNAKLGNGLAPIERMREKGINICLGTDGTASNNTLNMFREMGLLTMMHKAQSGNCVAMPSAFVIKSATENAAHALGMAHKLGEICVGAQADLSILDLHAVSLYPNNNIISSLCYSANGSEVDSVMVNGQFVMKNKELLTIDQEKVYFEIDRIKKKYL